MGNCQNNIHDYWNALMIRSDFTMTKGQSPINVEFTNAEVLGVEKLLQNFKCKCNTEIAR